MPKISAVRSRWQHLAETPWALYPQALVSLIERIQAGVDPGQLVAASRTHETAAPTGGAVAVIPMYGVINQRSEWWTELMGETSVDAIRESIASAYADPQVSAIVLDIDSPGGSVAGVTELATELRSIRGGDKPIVAVCNAFCASAAYWLASQADEVVATPSAQVGSIGVYSMHQDVSGLLEAEGIDITLISAGPHKVDGNMFEPLTDEARADIQKRVDATYSTFLEDVAAGRRVSLDAVRSDFGGGRVLTAKDAHKAGMIDRVETLSATITRLSKPAARRRIGQAAELLVGTSGIVESTTSATFLVSTVPSLPAAASAGEDLDPTVNIDDAPADGHGPFSERVVALAEEAEALATHAAERARLRAKAGRPAFSTTTERSLRSIRDAITSLLTPDESASSEDATPPVDPAPVVPVIPAVTPVIARQVSDAAWAAYLEEHLS